MSLFGSYGVTTATLTAAAAAVVPNSVYITTLAANNAVGAAYLHPPPAQLAAGQGITIANQTLSLANDGSGNLVFETRKRALLRTEDGREFDLVAMAEAMMEVMERLAVILPDLERHEHFPALRSAYQHYRTLHRLVRDEPLDDESND